MRTLVIDENACIGCGTCAVLSPKVFKMNEAGKAEVRQLADDQNADTEENIQNSINSCPVQAIAWKEA